MTFCGLGYVGVFVLVGAAPGYLAHGGESWVTGGVQVLDQQLDAVGDHPEDPRGDDLS